MTNSIRNNKHSFEAYYLEKENKLTIKVSGQFIFSAVGDFRKIYESNPIANNYVLDLAGVKRFDSAGLGCILAMFQFLKEKNNQVDLDIINASDDIQKVLECAKISHFLDGIQFSQ